MASLNKVLIMGNLTKDPEKPRRTPSGMAVIDMRVAMNRKFKTQSGEMKDETCFVNVSVWGRQAETCAEYLRKGSQVLIEGRLKYDEWEKDGQKHNRLSITGERVQFMSAPKQRTETGAGPGPGDDQSDVDVAPMNDSGRGPGPGPVGPAEGDPDDLPF